MWFKTLTIAAMTGALAGCYPGGPETFGDTDVVVTLRASDAIFEGDNTFALPDQVIDLGEVVPDDPEPTIDHRFDEDILTRVRSNLEAYGYTYTEDEEAADLWVPVGAIVTTTWVLYQYYDYWGYWGFYPGFGGGFWIGYPVYGISAYQTGTIVFSLVRPEDIEPVEEIQISEDAPREQALENINKVPAIWSATINGLVGSSAGTTVDRIQTTIDQAFDQSPYLDLNR